MLEFRRIFGREVARYAAVRATPESIARVEAIAEKAERTTSMLDLFDLDFEFYVAMTQAAGNAVMGLLINTVRDGVRSYMPVLSNLAPSAEVCRKHHRELIAALRAKPLPAPPL
jgi:DNA-binding FadR family transcriptional regulator